MMYIGTAMGGAIFPWTRKEVYNTSPMAKYKIAGIPVITICGIIATVFSAWMLYWYITVPGLGVISFQNLTSAIIMVAIFLFWVAYFFIRRWWLKRIGINLDLAFKEIPPV